MAKLLSSIPAWTFPEEWETVQVASSTPRGFVLRVNGTAVWRVTLKPVESTISIYDLGTLIRECAGGEIAEAVLETAEQGNTQKLVTSKVFPLRRRMGVTANAFIAANFLSLSRTPKITHRAARERVSWIGEENAVSVRCFWWTADGITADTRTVAAEEEDYARFADVSPSTFAPPEAAARLCRYVVTCGRRTRTFLLAPPGLSIGGGAEIAFRNTFGVMDVVHVFGEVERAAKPTYKTVSIGGRRRNYDTDCETTMTCTFAPLAPGDLSPEEAAVSEEVVLLPNRTEILPTEAEIKRGDDPTRFGTATVKFRIVEETAAEDLPEDRRRKIFDDSFDNSYE